MRPVEAAASSGDPAAPESPEPSGSAATAPVPAAAGTRAPGRAPAPAPANVLLVDDHAENLTALSAVLEPLGENLVLARSGAEALHHLLHADFALILLDVHMPGLGGFETARYITARERTRHIPIIFLTAFAADIDEVFRGYAAGAVDYVTKPFEPEVLRSKVAVFVALHRERAQRLRAMAAQAKAEAATETIRKLQSLSDAALAHLDLDELLAEVLTRIRELFGADTAGIALTDDAAGLSLRATDGLESVAAADALEPETLVARAAAASRPLVFDRRSGAPPLHPTLARTGVRSAVAVGLRTADELAGVVYLGWRQGMAPGAEDLALLELCAERAATAIAHARTYEHEHDLVELLQRSLLPQELPTIPRLELAARYLASVEATAIGGDWYDVLRLPDGGVALVIGDVVGHGVQAATVMGELRHGLRAYILEGHGPAGALARLDALVEATRGSRMIATLLVLLIDADLQRLRFASAGHLPPLLVGPDGAAAFLRGGLVAPLGMIGQTAIEEAVEPLAPGEAILLFTDGLVERRDESLDDGLARLRAVAADRAGEPLEAFCDHVLHDVGLGRSDHRDDVALVTLRVLGRRPEQLRLRLAAEPSALRGLRRELAAWLETVGAEAAEIEDLVLATSEAAANAVEHAYGPGDHEFELEAEQRDGRVHIQVRDFGGWRTTRGQLRGTGLKLIHQLCDTAVIHRGEEGTCIEMTRQVGPGGPAG
jgi:serine phosphatase RsbU (regulator of sigma subunit)/CheY-like chemotaxis protein/anti-sigma regulatory factor (Ser/Thr protein kinase)